MSLDVTDPSTTYAAGTARLRFSRCGARTVLDRVFATSPVKMFSTRGVGAACWVHAATLGGGFVGGDAVRLNIEVSRGAQALLTTQASTKVYRSRLPASQHITASLADESLLVVAPDPTVCFADADFSQEQRYELAGGASLVLVDWITSGRHAIGERWIFRHYSSRIDVRRGGRRILYDGVLLNQADGSIAERLGRFEVCLTAVIAGPLVSAGAAHIARAATALGIDKGADMVVSAWPLADDAAVLRMCGMGVEQVGAALRRQLAFLSPLLGEDPWSRKW